MLVQFSVGNYLSFSETVTLSMVASKINEYSDKNVFAESGIELLKSAVVYGANASGKSNLIKAMEKMADLMKNSSKESQAKEAISIDPYRLSSKYEGMPSFFEMIFTTEGTRYRYGFEVDREKVRREWLYHVPSERESKLFERTGKKFDISGPFREGKGLEEKTRDNALFLSVVAQFNGSISVKIINWLNSFNVLSGLRETSYTGFTLAQLEDPEMKSRIMDLIRAIDLGIEDIDVEQIPITTENLPTILPNDIKQLLLKQNNAVRTTIRTVHKKYDEVNRKVQYEMFSMQDSESQGTQKIFALAGPIVDTLKFGKTLIVDELDAKLHPHITRVIIGLFNSELNKNAQLIFNTHDINLLESKQLRRDQIWFTKKDSLGATDLYSLVEYQVRNDASFRKDYLAGRYGAIPILDELREELWGEK